MSTDADCPPSLNPDQIAAIDRAAAPLQASDREAFIEVVYDRLLGQTVLGDGLLHRLLAEAQREFLQTRPIVLNGRSARVPYHSASRVR